MKAWIKPTQVQYIDGTLKRGQLKDSDRALGFKWPTNHTSTGDIKRTTFAADTRTLQRKYLRGVPSFVSISSSAEPHFYFFERYSKILTYLVMGHTRTNCAVFWAVGVKMSTNRTSALAFFLCFKTPKVPLYTVY